MPRSRLVVVGGDVVHRIVEEGGDDHRRFVGDGNDRRQLAHMTHRPRDVADPVVAAVRGTMPTDDVVEELHASGDAPTASLHATRSSASSDTVATR